MREELRPQWKAFADHFIDSGNQTQSYRKAYPNCKTDQSADASARKLLENPRILAYIEEKTKPRDDKRIATAEDVMVFLTQMMNGEIKDAFGLDASNADRISAAREIMKRHNVVGDNNKDALERLDNVLEQIGGVV